MVAGELQFPSERIEASAGTGPEFTVGDNQFTEGGHYSPITGKVTVYADALGAHVLGTGLLAHEIEHARYDAVVRQGFMGEYDRYKLDATADNTDGSMKPGAEARARALSRQRSR